MARDLLLEDRGSNQEVLIVSYALAETCAAVQWPRVDEDTESFVGTEITLIPPVTFPPSEPVARVAPAWGDRAPGPRVRRTG